MQSYWSSQDWDGNLAKAREQKSLISFKIPKPDVHKKTLDSLDDIPFQKMMIETDRPEEKMMEVSHTLVPPSEPQVTGTTPMKDLTKLDGIKEENKGGLMEHELHLHREEEKYALYIGNLSPEESNTESETDDSNYSFCE